MADNLARSSDDSLDEDPSLDSILNRLNSLGESSEDGKESAPPLRGVPDLSPEEKALVSDSSDELVEPASLKVVEDADAPDSRFRSQGLFDVSKPDDTAAVVVSPDALANFLADGKDKSDQVESKQDKPEDESEVAETEAEAKEEPKDDEESERIDYFADLHVSEPTQIAGVPTVTDDESDLGPGLTVVEAFSKHPEGTLPDDYETAEEVLLTDTHGLLADPLDIKDVATTMDGADYEELFSHGVQFPGMSSSSTDLSDPLYVENPYEDIQSSSKGIPPTKIVAFLLLIAAVVVIYLILSDGSAVDEIREGVGAISQ